ncbi:hypothetical protein [Streptomyces sp. VRA16 Mangrove soil]|uniref:hypothetical protein n=1 Tax=Streptomyces sp. VRA16 Mangrove soil TaxID=2817434 RepID=UPI001A9F04BD|nr:hypothetical protein [Streptomyces sp. VRA16 Mangrove soil]MBO1336725.1 hypothetical protein [Streptomyces sp. VRA16 Mangrove soil]
MLEAAAPGSTPLGRGSTECSDYSGACLGLPCRELDGLLINIVALLSRRMAAGTLMGPAR